MYFFMYKMNARRTTIPNYSKKYNYCLYNSHWSKHFLGKFLIIKFILYFEIIGKKFKIANLYENL